MIVKIEDCDLNCDYFHFTNRNNIDSILNYGLIPSIGEASKLVDDRPNVSISKGAKGIMGIINSFAYKFGQEISISEIPETYRKYFKEISNFESVAKCGKDNACKAMARKLKDEIYFRVNVSEEQLKQAQIGGLTGYDINLPMAIDSSNIDLVTDKDNKVLSAYDVAKYIYEKAKHVPVFRKMHKDFFHMFELEKKNEFER